IPARPPPGDALHDFLVRRHYRQHPVDTAALRKHRVQQLRLAERARKSVEDKPLARVWSVETFFNQFHDRLVRDQISTFENASDLLAKRSLLAHRRAQQVATRDLRNARQLTKHPRLRAFARSRWAKQYQSHRYAPLRDFTRPRRMNPS